MQASSESSWVVLREACLSPSFTEGWGAEGGTRSLFRTSHSWTAVIRRRPAGSPRPQRRYRCSFMLSLRCSVHDVAPEAFRLEGVAACPVSSFLKYSLRIGSTDRWIFFNLLPVFSASTFSPELVRTAPKRVPVSHRGSLHASSAQQTEGAC